MARGKKAERTNPSGWRLEKFEDGQWQNADKMWRIVDGTGKTIAIAGSPATTALFAYKHLLAISKVADEIVRLTAPLKTDWANVDHLLKSADPSLLIKESEFENGANDSQPAEPSDKSTEDGPQGPVAGDDSVGENV